MLNASIPAKFNIVWGASAGSSYIRTIPQASQIGVQNGAASLTDGFPPLNFTPVAAGGTAPFGQDFNGILKQITQWNQWQQAGGAVPFDSTFANNSNTGGYPKNALIASTTFGNYWLSLIDNNQTNPDSGVGVGWVKVPLQPQPPLATPIIPSNNLYLGNNASLPNTSIDVQIGYIPYTADLRGVFGVTTKDIAVAWQPGSGTTVGGLDTTPPVGASKTVNVFLIKRALTVTNASRSSNVATLTVPSHGLGAGGSFVPYGIGQGYDGNTGVVIASIVDSNNITYSNTGSNQASIAIPNGALNAYDILCSGSTGPTIPVGWTQCECLGSFLTNGSGNLIPMTQVGDYFRWKSPAVDFNGVQSNTGQNIPLAVPSGVSVEARFNYIYSTTSLPNDRIYFGTPGDVVNIPDSANTPLSQNVILAASSEGDGWASVWTDTSKNVVQISTFSGAALRLATLGWRDPRRRLF